MTKNILRASIALIVGLDVVSARLNEERRLDSVCREGYRLRYAIQCSDDSVTLYPAPRNEKINRCAHPTDSWLHSKCNSKNKGGFKELLTMYSGCYPEHADFWEDFQGVVLDEGESSVGPMPLHIGADNPGPVIPPNMGFEDGNLYEWAVVGEASAVHSAEAIEGNYYANVVGSACSAVSLQRSLPLPEPPTPVDSSCALQIPGEGVEYCFTFQYRFEDYSFLIYNDWMKVSLGTPGSILDFVFTDYKDIPQVRDDGDTGWRTLSVTIPAAPAGIPFRVEFASQIEDEPDCHVSSYMKLDNFALTVGKCASTSPPKQDDPPSTMMRTA